MKPRQPVSFEQFMAHALHDPEKGYYAREITGIGHRGDFTTAPMLSDAPARAIAAWASHAMKETGCRHLIEIGPGEGKLAAGVLSHLSWFQRLKTRLHLVETSKPLAALQRGNLGKKASYHTSIHEALAECNGNAVIYSNELVDAFPVRRFKKAGQEWKEIAVHFTEDGSPVESLLESPLPRSSSFSIPHPADQCIEVHESYQKWLESWLPHWKKGKMLTIDYGSDAQSLYHRRPRGTIRGYLFHQLIEGMSIYQNPGRQDLTTDVNFTDLMDWSTPWVSSQSLVSYSSFLEATLDPASTIDQRLAQDNGAGTAFQVLEQTR